jgi:hypothetical protein
MAKSPSSVQRLTAFRAAMLKKRIKKWDLDRNHKQADMLYAVKVALERESQGKKTAFLIRGRVVSFEEVQHYFRRKGVRDLRSLLKEADAPAPTTRIECHTPELANIEDEVEDHHILGDENSTKKPRNHFHHFSSRITVIPDPNQVAGVPQQSPELTQLDQLLHHGRNYYTSLFEREDWKNQQKYFNLSSLESFYHNLFDGHTLLESGGVKVAFWHFDRAFSLIKRVLEQGPLLFLPYLYHILLQGRAFQTQDVLLKMLDFISEMIRMRFPDLRPVQDSLVLLHGMSPEQRRNCTSRSFQSILSQLKDAFQDCIPDEVQLHRAAEVLCTEPSCDRLLRDDDQGTRDVEGYQLTSLAVWRLARDADLLEFAIDQPAGSREEDELPYHFNNVKIGRQRRIARILVEYARTEKEALHYGRLAEPELHFAFYGTRFRDETLTIAFLQRLDAELQQETRISNKSPPPRQHVAFRPGNRRLGKRHTRIQQPSARSSF